MSHQPPADARTPRHPLDPLDADEIRQAVAALRGGPAAGEGWRFASIELAEPSKQALRAFAAGERTAGPDRQALVVCWNRQDGRAYKAAVSVLTGRVVSWEHQDGAQPIATLDEWHDCDVMLRAHPDVVEALAARGITDLSGVLMDTWAFGGFLVPERYRNRRVGWTDTWVRAAPGSNPYANPVKGLHCIVDLNTMELLELEDDASGGEPFMAVAGGEYGPDFAPDLVVRDDLKPLEIGQPEGVSFRLDGYALVWQRWSMRLGFNYREGLVIHGLSYDDGGETRSIAHRMSFAEMVVPYRDATNDHRRRTAFDIGEWGLGFMTTGLELGCDCVGEIAYLDAVLHDSSGEPYTVANAICIHEEDDRILWKHVDPESGAEVRRSRRLVVSFHATVANYEYLIYWNFYQDGNVECEVRATGLLVTGELGDGERRVSGATVGPRRYGPIHQHFVVARLDFDIDGEDNTVQVSDTMALPINPDNPHGLALQQRNRSLLTEADGRQDYDWSTQRSWKVVNESRLNRYGDPVGYRLVPGACLPAMFDPSSPVFRRAQVIGHTLWVTPFRADERWPCGEFVNQSDGDGGLPEWTAADRPIVDTDVVLWYVFGIHHVPRPEDWPVMPADRISFWLKPAGFFDRNPSLDVAPG